MLQLTESLDVTFIMPHAYPRGVAISFVIIVVVDTKIAKSGDLVPEGSCMHNKSAKLNLEKFKL